VAVAMTGKRKRKERCDRNVRQDIMTIPLLRSTRGPKSALCFQSIKGTVEPS